MYVPQEFPKWKYHPTSPARMVHDPEQEAALGEGWADTPAAFEPAAEAEATPEAAGSGAATETAKPRGQRKAKAEGK